MTIAATLLTLPVFLMFAYAMFYMGKRITQPTKNYDYIVVNGKESVVERTD